MAIIFVFFIASCIARTWANNCPPLVVDDNFNKVEFLGRWFEQYRFNEREAVNTRCNIAKYSKQDPTHTSLLMKGYTARSEKRSKRVVLRSYNPSEPAKFKLTFNPDSTPADYYVLSTDHISYAIVAAFKDLGDSCREHAWILTRELKPLDSLLSSAIEIAETHGVDIKKFLRSNQTKC